MVAVPSFKSPPEKQGFFLYSSSYHDGKSFPEASEKHSSREPLTQNWVTHSTPKPVTAEGSRPPLVIQFSSVAQLCPTLCDPMNRSTAGLPVHHHLPEFTQTHVHRIRDAIQPSHPLSSPSPPSPNPSQHQNLFQ